MHTQNIASCVWVNTPCCVIFIVINPLWHITPQNQVFPMDSRGNTLCKTCQYDLLEEIQGSSHILMGCQKEISHIYQNKHSLKSPQNFCDRICSNIYRCLWTLFYTQIENVLIFLLWLLLFPMTISTTLHSTNNQSVCQSNNANVEQWFHEIQNRRRPLPHPRT